MVQRSSDHRPRVFGHGSSTPGDELNSRASFERVLGLPIDGVELDVRRTADDALVVHHDAALPDGRALHELSRHDLPAHMLLLADVLDICAGVVVNIEIKNFSIDQAFDPAERVTDLVLALLRERGGGDRVLVSSFGMGCVDHVRRHAPHIDTAVLLYYPGHPEALLDDVVVHGHRIVHPFAPNVDEAFMAAARARDLEVNVWTGRDDAATLQRLVALDVDGIITGRPELLVTVQR